MDRGITGNFEVTIVETNALIHSKGSKGNTTREREAIVEAIREALERV